MFSEKIPDVIILMGLYLFFLYFVMIVEFVFIQFFDSNNMLRKGIPKTKRNTFHHVKAHVRIYRLERYIFLFIKSIIRIFGEGKSGKVLISRLALVSVAPKSRRTLIRSVN